MIKKGKIINKLPEEKVELELLDADGCGSCKGCVLAMGSENKRQTIIVNDPQYHKLGDEVELEIESKNFYKAFSLIFVIPLAVFVGSAVIFMNIGWSEGQTFIISFALLLGSFIFAKRSDKQTKEECLYKII